jgi:hypothetical protein
MHKICAPCFVDEAKLPNEDIALTMRHGLGDPFFEQFADMIWIVHGAGV